MNIKRIVSLFVCTTFIILIAGCRQESAVRNILEQSATPTPEQTPEPAVPTPTEEITLEDGTSEESNSEEGIDVDLTQLSSTMVYSEVYNMVFYPENYIGKTVKMSGSYMVFHEEGTDKYYHACIISDATACCAQGIEFELAGEHRYPDDYPELGAPVCVVGVFDIYREGEEKFCTLRDARIV